MSHQTHKNNNIIIIIIIDNDIAFAADRRPRTKYAPQLIAWVFAPKRPRGVKAPLASLQLEARLRYADDHLGEPEVFEKHCSVAERSALVHESSPSSLPKADPSQTALAGYRDAPLVMVSLHLRFRPW